MAYSFQVVEDKLFEAQFFLEKLGATGPLSFEAKCYFSAFVSACRSVTLALQFSMDGVEGFGEWYETAREALGALPMSKYFKEVRNEAVHEGKNPLNVVPIKHLKDSLLRPIRAREHSHALVIPDESNPGDTVLADALPRCSEYFVALVSLVYECYSCFRTVVDPRWYFTEGNFRNMGKTLEDALNELGFPSSWAAACPPETDAWAVLRCQQPITRLNPLFENYLGKFIPDPDGDAT